MKLGPVLVCFLAVAAACKSKGDDFMVMQGDDTPAIDAGSGMHPEAGMPDANPNSADLAITITASPDPVAASSVLTYKLDVTNHGPKDITGTVTVVQNLPSGNVTPGTASGQDWMCTRVTQVLTCTRAGLLMGSAPTITVPVTPTEGATLTTMATVSSATEDDDQTNNTASASTTVLAPGDVSVTMTEANGANPATPGGTLTYTITVANGGPGQAVGVSVKDTLPAGAAYVSAMGTGWSCPTPTSQDVTCTLPTLAAGPSSVLTVVATAPASGGTLTNTALLTTTSPDSTPGNNTATVMTVVKPNSSLALTNTASPLPTVVAGSKITYTLNLHNGGPDPAASVVVTDTLAGNVSFLDTTGTGNLWACVQTGQQVKCTANQAIASMADASSIIIHVSAPANAAGDVTNSATVTSSSYDANTADNTATSTTTTALSADVSIAHVNPPTAVATGGTLTYQLQAANAGPSDATSVVVTDTLPTGATYQNFSGAGWACSLVTGQVKCTTSSLPPGNAPLLTITATAPSAATTATNTVTIASAITDPNPTTNNTSTVNTTVQAPADLSLALSASPDPVAASSTLTYTIAVTNNGPADAANVTVTDRLPDGNVTFVSALGTGWTCPTPTGQVVTCTRTSLLVGAAPTITVKITTPATFSTLVDTATVGATTADNDNSNNSQTIGTNGATPSADLGITIAASADPVAHGQAPTHCQGDNVGCEVYTIGVTNAGPEDATGVSVVLTLPAAGSFYDVGGSGWVCPAAVGNKITCTRSTGVTHGTSAPDITLYWTAPNPGGFSIILGAEVDTTATDPNLANNTASASVKVNP